MELLKSILLWSGIPLIVHRHFYNRHLTILTYHGVVEDELDVPDWCFIHKAYFDRQMRFIKKHFEVVKLSEGIKRLYRGEIERPTIAVTFDDGFRNNHDVAFPILKRLGVPATIFLTTGLIDSDDTVWFCRVNDALANTSKSKFRFQGEAYSIANQKQKIAVSRIIQEKLKDYPPDMLMEKCIALIKELGIAPDKKMVNEAPFRMLDNDAIRAMANSGLIEFGCHTHRHCILTHLSQAECRGEIAQSKQAIEDLIQGECRLFAYPNGGWEDIPEHCAQLMEQCDISAAVTTVRGKNSRKTPNSMLKRCGAGAWQTFADFKLMVLGAKEIVKQSLDTIARMRRSQGEYARR